MNRRKEHGNGKNTENGVAIALVTGTCALTDEQTALDLFMEARYTLGAERICH